MAANVTTVRDVMQSVFPRGYSDHRLYKRRLEAAIEGREGPSARPRNFRNPPCAAVDLFALAGTLLLRSGAYHHVSPQVPKVAPRSLTVNEVDRKRWIAVGADWRGDGEAQLPPPPSALVSAWKELLKWQNEPVFQQSDLLTSAPPWWWAALELFCIADEAALEIGFATSRLKSAQAHFTEFPLRQRLLLRPRLDRGTFTISSADSDQVCVLPKSRTPKVGCTIRSLSHNLTLLPPRGLARSYWRFAPPSQEAAQIADIEPFNVVVLPMPFQIHATAFKGRPASAGSWGWFDVDPHWCPGSASGGENTVDGFSAFIAFVNALLAKAEADVGKVHALVLPEVALSSQVFRLLCDELAGRPDFELLISGLFDASEANGDAVRHGNFTGMARFVRGASGKVGPDISIREKHHRWRIDRTQIETYALGSALDVNFGWWEHIDILSRSLDVFVLRGGATVTTLICEDLARSDPCQELVRGIGPNFVVALLMDGPQLKTRWPARYGTVLAEDPGSSVLTVTSFGLIRRSNETAAYPPAREIALFQDDSGKMTQIQLAAGAQATCLTLQPSPINEQTLDGRHDNGGAQSWRLSGVVPISIGNPNEQIMLGSWPSAKGGI